MKTILFSLFAILLITSTSYAQNSADTLSQKRHFRITSFVVDGREIPNIKAIFLLDGQEIVPENVDGLIYEPDEMQEAPYEKSGMRFTAPNIDFVFNNVRFKGYLDTDDVTSDYEISITTDPAKLKQILKDNEKRHGKSRS